MNDAIRQLDRRFKALAPLAATIVPPKGWVRAIRKALGMTAVQLGKRLGVSHARALEIEKAELTGGITLRSMEAAARALGCRFVYVLVPETSLQDIEDQQTQKMFEARWNNVQQTMLLENQAVEDADALEDLRRRFLTELLRRPSHKWEEP